MLRVVNATDLNSWANTRVSQQEVPKLVRMLVSATTDSIERTSFPAGDSVQSGGFDGLLITAVGSAFVPQGLSIWEFGTDRNPKGKADGDYRKRTENSRGIDKSNATFVFVTPRKWGNKEAWEAEKKQEGQWADVRAYDADDIEQWLEMAPAVNVWMGHLIGKRPEHSQDLESFWNEWRSATNPEFSEGLLLSSRDSAIERLQKWLDGGEALTVQSDSLEESIAFLTSYIETLPTMIKHKLLSRCVIAYEPNVFRTLLTNNDQLILVPSFTGSTSVGAALQRGHKVYVPLDKSVSSANETVILPSFNTRTLEAALVTMNVPPEEARELASISRGSLSILRRLTAVIPEVYAPLWARPETARDLVPFLLVGEWNHINEHDRNVISKIAGKSYDEVLSVFTRWANVSDAPVRKIGNIYQLTSRIDSWQNLSKYIDIDDVTRLSEVVEETVAVINPRYELPKDERYLAALHGKILLHSNNIRRGLSESLAMLSSHNNIQISERAQGIVWKLLRDGASWVYWASLDDALPFLAEAAPDAFLTGLERSISEPRFEIGNIFKQETSMGGCAQSDLLWALETCAWNPSYLGRVAVLLAKLDAIDEGGNYSNRPFNSLIDIFLCWHPQTMANVSKRFEVIDSLLKYEPSVGWRLLLELLPSSHSSTTGTHKPKWKDWAKEFEVGVTNIEYIESVENVAKRVVVHVLTDTSRLAEVVDKINLMPPEYCNQFVSILRSDKIHQIDQETKIRLWGKLRQEVYRNRKYSDADWSLPTEITDSLYEIYQTIEPGQLIDKYVWLFDWHPEHPECISEDWHEEEEKIKQKQLEAIQDILQQRGLTFLVEMAEHVKRPSSLGYLAGKYEQVLTNITSILTDSMANDSINKSQFTAGLVESFFQEKGWEGAVAVTVETSTEWNNEQKAAFFRYLPFAKATWEHLSGDSEVREIYWRGLPSWLRPHEEDYTEAVNSLLEYGRPCAAFFIVSHLERAKVSPSTDMIIEVLFQLIKDIPDSQDWKSVQSGFDYEFNRLLEYLDASGVTRDVIEQLEWIYLPLFRYGRKPKYLIQKVAREPEFFAQVIEAAFRKEIEIESGDEETTTIDENDKYRARLAYELLNECILVPGKNTDGTLNGQILKTWISDAREKCSLFGRSKVADSEIGQLLAYAPFGTDGLWPHEDVRDIIEEISSESLESGLRTGVYNKRGTVTKSIGEGGLQERALAEQYKQYAQACEGKWIRTATILSRISERYMDEAKKEDERAELD
jgi:hypothetical protein